MNVDNDKIKTQRSFICKPLILRMSIEGVGTKGRLAGVMYLSQTFLICEVCLLLDLEKLVKEETDQTYTYTY